MSNALNFLFFFCVFYCYLKEKGHIRININSKKRTIYMRKYYYYYYYYYFDLKKIRVVKKI